MKFESVQKDRTIATHLKPITDAKNGYSELEHLRVDVGRILVVDGVRRSRKNDA